MLKINTPSTDEQCCAGYNQPGYLRTVEEAQYFETFAEARQWLAEVISACGDYEPDYPEEVAECNRAADLIRSGTGPCEVTVGPWVYWVHPVAP